MTSSFEQQPASPQIPDETRKDITIGFATTNPETVPSAQPEAPYTNMDVAHEAHDYIAWMIQHATSPELANTYRELFSQHGDAFAAFLCLDKIDQSSASLEQDFTDAYLWSAEDEESLVVQELADLGWEEALNEFLNQQGIHEEALRWDMQFLRRLLNWTYEIVPMYGVLYVFEK